MYSTVHHTRLKSQLSSLARKMGCTASIEKVNPSSHISLTSSRATCTYIEIKGQITKVKAISKPATEIEKIALWCKVESKTFIFQHIRIYGRSNNETQLLHLLSQQIKHTLSESQQYMISFSYDAEEGVTSNFLCHFLNSEMTSSTFNKW